MYVHTELHVFNVSISISKSDGEYKYSLFVLFSPIF